ncbi:MAG TPA: hypothetical protein VJ917_03655 [Saprospiraceae bacterium]|nr:hypothetical protein [Saprospiraceae bacterium]
MTDLATSRKIQTELEALSWPAHWRLWIYVSGRPLSDEQVHQTQSSFTQFQTSWSAHGKALKSDMAFLQNQVLLIAVDEDHAKTTGCSLDKLTQFVAHLEANMKTDFLDRSKFYVYDEENTSWRSLGRNSFKKAYQTGEINADSVVLDTLVDRAENMEKTLIKALSSSWHAKII